MTSQERVIAAIEHREPDRIPVDLGGSIMTGISVFAIPALREALGLEQSLPKAYELFQMLGEVEPDIIDALGVDVLPVEPDRIFFDIPRTDYKRWTHPNGREMLVPGAFQIERDKTGNMLLHESGDQSKPVVARMPEGGFYFDKVESQSLSFDYEPPAIKDLEDDYLAPLEQDHLDILVERARELRPTGKALFLGDWTKFGPPQVGNTPNWLCVLAGDRDYVRDLFALRAEGDIKRLEQLSNALGDTVDIIGVDGYDYGTQRATLFSPETFEFAHLPYYTKVIGWIHEHTEWKTWKHTCGSTAEFLPMFIDAGLDCINPVQISAAGMDPESLKDRFGEKITFWGGGIDTQHTLPFGAPDEVYEEVCRLIRIFGRGGGFVFNTVHNVQGNSPAANLDAMIRAIRDCGGYPLASS